MIGLCSYLDIIIDVVKLLCIRHLRLHDVLEQGVDEDGACVHHGVVRLLWIIREEEIE